MTVEVDGDFLEGFEGADDAFDADPGGVLEVAGYGQGGHDHGQVGPGGVSGVVEDGVGWQVWDESADPVGTMNGVYSILSPARSRPPMSSSTTIHGLRGQFFSEIPSLLQGRS